MCLKNNRNKGRIKHFVKIEMLITKQMLKGKMNFLNVQ